MANIGNGIGIKIHTNFDFKSGKEDLELALKQLQQNTKLNIKVDSKGLAEVSKYTETTAKGASEATKKITEYNDKVGTTVKITEELNKKTKEWAKSSTVTYDVSKAEKTLQIEKQKTNELENQLKIYKRQKDAQLKEVEDKYGKVGFGKNKKAIEDLKETVNGLTVANGKLVNSNTGVETSFSNVNKEIDIVKNNAKNSINIFDKISDNIKKFANWFLVGGFVVGAKRFVTDMFSTINQFDKQLTDIRIVTGETTESVNRLAETYNKLGQQIGATTSDIMAGSIEWIRQGKSFAETQELVQASIMQSKLSGIEASQSTEYLTAVLNGYQLEADKATSVIDKMVAVDNAAATSVAEISAALQRCSNSASMAGVDLDKLISYVGTVSSVTRKSAESIGESFKTIFSRYQDIKIGGKGGFLEDGIGVADVEKVFDTIGVKIKENETTFRSFSDVLEDLSVKWDTLNDVEKSSVAKSLAGTRQRENFLVLMNNMSKAHDLEKESLDSEGLAVDRYGIYLESTEAKANKFKATLEELYMKTINSDFTKGVIDLGTGVLKLINTLGGIVPLLITINGFMIISKLGVLSKSIVGVTTKLKEIPLVLSWIKAGEVSVAGGLSLLNINPIIASITAITVALTAFFAIRSSIKQSQEQAIATAKEENVEINSQLKSTGELLSKYEELEKQSKNNKEVREQLLQVQKDLVGEFGSEISGIDLVNKSYDENIEILDKVIERKKILKGLNDEKIALDAEKDVEKVKKEAIFVVRPDMDGLKSLGNVIDTLTREAKQAFDLSNDNNGSLVLKFKAGVDTETAIKAIDELKEAAELKGLDISMYEPIIRVYDELATKADILASLQDEKIQEDAKETVENIKKANSIKDVTNATIEQYKQMKQDISSKFGGSISKASENADKLTVALQILNEMFPQFADETSDASDGTDEFSQALSNLQAENGKTVGKVQTLNDAINTLNKGSELTSEQIEKLTTTYPQLYDAVEKVDGIYTINVGTLENLRNMTVEEQRACIQGQIDKCKQVQAGTLERINNYKTEIGAIKTLAEAQASLASLSAKQYGINTKREHGGFGGNKAPTVTNPLEGQDKALYADLKTYEQTFKDIEAFEKELMKFDINTSLGNSKGYKPPKSGGSKSKGSSAKDTVKNELDAALKTIQKYRSKIDEEISTIAEKIKFEELNGNTGAVDKYNQRLDVLYTNRVKATLEENESYQLLKKKFKDEESIAKLESLIASNNKTYQSDKVNDLEHEISLIDKKYELEKEGYDNKTKQIELDQTLMNEDSEIYLEKQREKYDLLVAEQQMYMDKIRLLKAQGFSEESQKIKELEQQYGDLEQSKYSMIKWFADKSKEKELERINKQKKAIEDLINYEIQMEKEKHKEKIDNLKKEAGAYEAALNARKKAIQDNVKDEDYQDGLNKKQAELNDITNRIKILSADKSDKALAQVKDLEAGKAKIEDDIKKTQRDRGVDLEIRALDDELDRYKKQQDSKIAAAEKEANDEVKIREEAIRKIENRSDSLYRQLMQWSTDYGNVTGDEITTAWDTCGQALDQYANKTQSLIELQRQLAREIESINKSGSSSFVSGIQSSLNDRPFYATSKKEPSSPKMTEQQAKIIEQNNEKEYLHVEARKAKNEGDKAKIAWIESERRKWGLDPESGGVVKEGVVPRDIWESKKKLYGIYHQGGIVGRDGMNSNSSFTINPQTEEFAKLLKGEGVFTQAEMARFMDTTLPQIASNKSISIEKLIIEELIHADKIDNDNVNEVVDKAVKQVYKSFNSTFGRAGFVIKG